MMADDLEVKFLEQDENVLFRQGWRRTGASAIERRTAESAARVIAKNVQTVGVRRSTIAETAVWQIWVQDAL